MRGYNLSSKPPNPEDYRPKVVIEDLKQMVEHLGYEKFTLVGHDAAGMAFIFASFYPKYVDKLVIINAPHPTMMYRQWLENPEQKEGSQYVLLFQSPDAERIFSENNFAEMEKRFLGNPLEQGHMNEDDLKVYREAWAQPGALTGAFNYYRALSAAPLSGKEEQVRPTRALMINVPTLIIWGEKDESLLPTLLDGLEEYVPDLRITRFPDASGQIVHEKPEVVNKLIREFIESRK